MLCVFGTLLISVCTAGQTASAKPLIPDKFTNLHALPKGISKADLVAEMKSFTRALGVRCIHCHVGSDDLTDANFATDQKPEKVAARQMIKMTATINKKFVSQIKLPDDSMPPPSVNCWTCHRGKAKPEAPAPPATAEKK